MRSRHTTTRDQGLLTATRERLHAATKTQPVQQKKTSLWDKSEPENVPSTGSVNAYGNSDNKLQGVQLACLHIYFNPRKSLTAKIKS